VVLPTVQFLHGSKPAVRPARKAQVGDRPDLFTNQAVLPGTVLHLYIILALAGPMHGNDERRTNYHVHWQDPMQMTTMPAPHLLAS
jgi:hypothetical protein